MWDRDCVYLVLPSPHDSDAVAGIYLADICGDVGLWKGCFFEVATGAIMSAHQVPTRGGGERTCTTLGRCCTILRRCSRHSASTVCTKWVNQAGTVIRRKHLPKFNMPRIRRPSHRVDIANRLLVRESKTLHNFPKATGQHRYGEASYIDMPFSVEASAKLANMELFILVVHADVLELCVRESAYDVHSAHAHTLTVP